MTTIDERLTARLELAREREQEERRKALALRAELKLAQQANSDAMPRTRDWLTDVGASALRGSIKAAKSTYSAIAGVAEYVTDRTGDVRLNIGNGRPWLEVVAPAEMAKRNEGQDAVERTFTAGTDALGAPQTVAGGITEGITQFVVGMLPVSRIAKSAGILQGAGQAVTVARGLALGAVTSGIAFEGHEANLANLVQQYPSLQNPVTEFLATDEEDSEIVGRLKNAVTDAGAGAVFEGFIAGLRGVRAMRRLKAAQGESKGAAQGARELDLDAVKLAADEPPAPPAKAVTEGAPEGAPKEAPRTAEQAAAEGEPKAAKGSPEGAPKEAPREAASAPEVNPQAATEGIDYGKLSDDENVTRLAQRLGIDDTKLADIRQRIASGEVKPEDVSELIGINGNRIDWSNVKDAEGMVGLLNSVTRVMDGAVADAAGYAPTSIETISKHAAEMGGSFDEAVGIWERIRNAPAAVMAQRATLMASAQRLQSLANKVRSGTASNAEKLELAVHDRRHALLQTVARGTRAEIGRALRVMRESVEVNEGSLKMSRARHAREERAAREAAERTGLAVTDNLPTVPGGAVSDADLASALDSLGINLADLGKLADTLATAPDLAALNAASRSALNNSLMQRVLSLYINNLLSGLPTTVINITSVVQRAVENVAEKFGAQALGLRGSDKWERTLAAKSTVALASSWRAAWTVAGKAWKEGLPQTDIAARHESIKYSKAITGNATLDAVLTAPSRVILTVDEFAKHLFYTQELTARAVEVSAHAARMAGKDGDKVFRDTLEATLKNPPDDLALDAIEYARRSTFQEDFTSETMKGLQSFLGAAPALRFAVPFVKTPANILWQGFAERTPLGLLSRQVRDELALPGRKGKEAQVRMMLGTAAVGIFAAYADEGNVTGLRRAGRDSAALDGAPPYSIKIGNTWVQYNRLDPIGTVLAFAADARRLMDDDGPEAEGIGASLLALTVQNLTDKTFFKGLSDLMEVISGMADGRGTEAAGRYLAGITSNIIPFSAMQRNIAKQHDEYAREAWTIMDRVLAQTPGLSTGLALKRDLLGRPVRNTERLGPDLASPFLVGKDDADPVARAIASLEVTYRMPDKDIGGVKLSPQQYSRLVELTGSRLHSTMGEWIGSKDWQAMAEPMRREVFSRVYSAARDAGKRALLGEDERLFQQVVNAKEAAQARKTGTDLPALLGG